jgi:hypothetical protein
MREIKAIVALAGLEPGDYVLDLDVRADQLAARSAVPIRVR